MLQGLLADRFRLKFHREMREIPVERLVIGKDLKLKATALTEAPARIYTHYRLIQSYPSLLEPCPGLLR